MIHEDTNNLDRRCGNCRYVRNSKEMNVKCWCAKYGDILGIQIVRMVNGSKLDSEALVYGAPMKCVPCLNESSNDYNYKEEENENV